MKNILFCGLFLTATLAASPIVILSGDGVNESNNITGTNVLINPHPLWQANSASKWISYALTGNGQTSPANVSGTITGGSAKTPTARFFETFTINGIPGSGSIQVWADDTARVSLNGTVLFEANPVQGGACANGPIGCLPQNGQTINLTPHLIAGLNTLQFDVYQRGGGPFGLLYNGRVDFSQVPEPSSLALVGGALVSAVISLKRRQA